MITARKQNCGKVMFLHLSVSHSVHRGEVYGKEQAVLILLECFLVGALKTRMNIPRAILVIFSLAVQEAPYLVWEDVVRRDTCFLHVEALQPETSQRQV